MQGKPFFWRFFAENRAPIPGDNSRGCSRPRPQIHTTLTKKTRGCGPRIRVKIHSSPSKRKNRSITCTLGFGRRQRGVVNVRRSVVRTERPKGGGAARGLASMAAFTTSSTGDPRGAAAAVRATTDARAAGRTASERVGSRGLGCARGGGNGENETILSTMRSELSARSLESLARRRRGALTDGGVPLGNDRGAAHRSGGDGDLHRASNVYLFCPRRRSDGTFCPSWTALPGPGLCWCQSAAESLFRYVPVAQPRGAGIA